MGSLDEDLSIPNKYKLLSLSILRMTSRMKIANFLNLEGNLVSCTGEIGEIDIFNNYTGLAELAKFSNHEIMNIKLQKNPTEELLEQWPVRDYGAATLGNLWQYLYLMKRFDVLTACRNTILNDCHSYEKQRNEMEPDATPYNLEQDPTVSNSNQRDYECVTLQDVVNGRMTYYDAFVCYTCEDEEDRKFVRDIIQQLEVNKALKLFIPGRDDLPGVAQHTTNTYLIAVRCRRVLILISKAFLQSAECDFQVKFAHSLVPGARSKKLIPIIRERDTPIPNILSFLNVCDFSRTDMLEWEWTRLATAIKAPIDCGTYFMKENTTTIKETFLSTRSLDDHIQNRDSQADNSDDQE